MAKTVEGALKQTKISNDLGTVLVFNKTFRQKGNDLSNKLGDIDTRLLSDNDVIAMKKLYFAKVSTTIGKWIENNANLEYKFWISDSEVPRNPQVEVETLPSQRIHYPCSTQFQPYQGWFYSDMHLVLQKLISDTIKSGQKISTEMAKPIFSVLIQQTRQIRTCLFDLALKFKEQYDQGSSRRWDKNRALRTGRVWPARTGQLTWAMS